MTPDQRIALDQALRRAFRTRGQFERVFTIWLGRSLDEIADTPSLKTDIAAVIVQFESDDKIEDLLIAATNESTNAGLRRIAETILGRSIASAAATSAVALGDTVAFDLVPLEEAFRDALKGAAPYGFVVRYGEEPFVTKFRDRVVGMIGSERSQGRPAVSLNAAYQTVEDSVRAIQRYRDVLADKSIVCVIQADAAASDVIGRFWESIVESCGTLSNYLILIFTVNPEAVMPVGLVDLPVPRFTTGNVKTFTGGIVVAFGQPIELGNAWADRITEWSQRPGRDSLDVRTVYETLDETLQDLRRDQQAFFSSLS